MDEAEAIERFNKIRGRLIIELSEPAVLITPKLSNLRAPPTARIVSLQLEPSVFDEEQETFRPPRAEELKRIVFRRPRMRLRGVCGFIVEHLAPDGQTFTARDVLAAIEETERRARGTSNWFGGVDIHHIFFEGIHPDDEKGEVWRIVWGS